MALSSGKRSSSMSEASGELILLQDTVMRLDQVPPEEESDDHCSLAETMSSCGSSGADENDVRPCDACPNCEDVCDNQDCSLCANKRSSWKRSPVSSPLTVECGSLFPKVEHRNYTMCEVKRNMHADSCWLVAGDTIYDATSFLKCHPGGATCILRSAGGRKDCTKDISLHSKRAQLQWNQNVVGKLRPCGCHQPQQAAQPRPWWLFWP